MRRDLKQLADKIDEGHEAGGLVITESDWKAIVDSLRLAHRLGPDEDEDEDEKNEESGEEPKTDGDEEDKDEDEDDEDEEKKRGGDIAA